MEELSWWWSFWGELRVVEASPVAHSLVFSSATTSLREKKMLRKKMLRKDGRRVGIHQREVLSEGEELHMK
jgi:hypothetical protein